MEHLFANVKMEDVVQVTCVDGTVHEGSVFVTPCEDGVMVLRKGRHHTYQKADYIVIPAQSVKDIATVSHNEEPVRHHGAVHPETTRSRVRKTVSRHEKALRRINKNASEADVAIFDALVPVFQETVWGENTDIVLKDGQVVISKPYNDSDIKILPGELTPAYIEANVIHLVKGCLKLGREKALGGSPTESSGSSAA